MHVSATSRRSSRLPARPWPSSFQIGHFPPIEVSRGISEPVTHFERGPSGEIRVELNVEGPYWAQFAFQFGHEMCHVLCEYGDYPNPNKWFEETLCETASLFVLGLSLIHI